MPAISLFHTFTRLCTEKPAKWERRTQGEKIRLLNLHFLFFFFCTFGGTKVLSRYSHLFLLLHLLQERHRVIPQQLYTIEKSEERGRKRRRRDGEREDALYSFSFFFQILKQLSLLLCLLQERHWSLPIHRMHHRCLRYLYMHHHCERPH